MPQLNVARRHACASSGVRPGLSPCAGQRALHAPQANGGMSNPILTSGRLLELSFRAAERDGVIPRTVMAFLLYKVRSYTVCRSLNRAGPSRHARSAYLSNRPTRVRGSKDPIPEYRRERSE
jgi:hypothetical protein